jgi:hypothetical protein
MNRHNHKDPQAKLRLAEFKMDLIDFLDKWPDINMHSIHAALLGVAYELYSMDLTQNRYLMEEKGEA